MSETLKVKELIKHLLEFDMDSDAYEIYMRGPQS